MIPTMMSPHHRYGVKTIKNIVVSGIAYVQNPNYTLVNATQTNQCLLISFTANNANAVDLSGYICTCTFDFYFVN